MWFSATVCFAKCNNISPEYHLGKCKSKHLRVLDKDQSLKPPVRFPYRPTVTILRSQLSYLHCGKAYIKVMIYFHLIHWCTAVHHIPNGLVAMISACHSHRQSAGDQGSIPCWGASQTSDQFFNINKSSGAGSPASTIHLFVFFCSLFRCHDASRLTVV